MEKVLSGNEILIQGALEASVDLLTGYPGSPLADFFNILYEQKDALKAQGIQVVIANSEAHAAAMASGAKMANKNVLVAMKSMGLHVASDALSVGNFANPGDKSSGVVIAVGDDPWSISTSTPADSRYLFKHLHIPFLEPSTPQELKEWIKVAMELSSKSSVYVGVILTTHLAEGGGKVEIHDFPKKSLDKTELDPKKFNLSENVMVPPNSLLADQKMIETRYPKYLEELSKARLDIIYSNQKSIGIISSGAIFETLKQVLEESSLINEFSLMKLASAYPLNEKIILNFLSGKKYLVVVEEKRSFLETELRSFIQMHKLDIQIFGKEFSFNAQNVSGFPAFGGLSYEIIYTKLIEFMDLIQFDKSQVTCELNKTNVLPQYKLDLDIALPKRLPTFCPGCPHRETLSIMKEIRQNLLNENVNLISHGDVGCYSLSFLEPFKEMHDLSAMGQGGALGAGADIFLKNPSVVLMGDSTFFHSGMTAISNSVQLGHNITYILLDNDNTAMTGHQMTPVSGMSVQGEARPRQEIMNIVRAMKVDYLSEVNPSDRYFYKNLLSDVIKRTGTKVIISNKECALTFHGRLKSSEKKVFNSNQTIKEKIFYQINTFACEDCRVCVEMTGCPGLSKTEDAYGSKVMIDPQICVSDSYCTKLKACPSFELVKVADYHPTLYQDLKASKIGELPNPKMKVSTAEILKGNSFDLVVIGVGGSGVTTISRIIAEASLKIGSDINFKFVDQKGLAQRNGSVTSFLSFFAKNKSHSQVTGMGQADVVISPDLLEGARAISYLKKDGMLFIDANYQTPLSILLDRNDGSDLFSEEYLQEKIEAKLQKQLVMGPFKAMAYEQLGKNVYGPTILLGVLFQAGYLPFSQDDLVTSMEKVLPKSEIKSNIDAFQLGRSWWLAHTEHPIVIPLKTEKLSKEDYIISLKETVYPWQNKERFEVLFRNYLRLFTEKFPDVSEMHWAQYIHDLIVYDLGASLADYYEKILELEKLYKGEEFKQAVRILTKTYWVKDEVFVAHLLSGHLKRKLDKLQFKKLGKSFVVHHINRPSFDILGKKIEFDIQLKEWPLYFFKFLRSLRILMPKWHREERNISTQIRKELMDRKKSLNDLERIKGYREVRFGKAEGVF